jgi:hypothetical protein
MTAIATSNFRYPGSRCATRGFEISKSRWPCRCRLRRRNCRAISSDRGFVWLAPIIDQVMNQLPDLAGIAPPCGPFDVVKSRVENCERHAHRQRPEDARRI